MACNMKKKSHLDSDAVSVFCRVRPIEDDEESCLTVLNDQQVLLKESVEHATAKGNSVLKESTFNFSYVFDQDVSQRRIFDDVACNLITDLFRGKSSLLMTYGVTSSGKTYTMNGKPSDIGILPRSIDVLFNSVGNYLAHKCVFKPDKLNGFDVQSEADAITERHRNMEKGLRDDKPGTKWGKYDFKRRVSDVRKISEIDEDNVYGVFISYIEIYNNYIFDLLDDSFENTITGERKSKSLREDANRIMYVSGANEVEVDSVEDAFYWLNKGQHRRRLADTALNRESSRSHSIFKIRVVQAPVDKDNEPVVDKSCLLVSQLCLVDLAGSERLMRTKATGNQLTEAKSINSSLMVLKNCIDALRENQKDKSCARIVPYRDSKLTHLFRNYFEGNGLVRMICCVNPHVKEYDENIYVLKFAESCREVEIPRIDENMKDKMKKRANKIFETSMNKLSVGESDAKRHCAWTYPNFPFDELQDSRSDQFYSTLTDYLTEFDATKRQYWEYYESNYEECLEYLECLEEGEAEKSSLLKEYEEKLAAKSRQVSNLETRIRSLEKKLTKSETEAKDLRSDSVEKEKLLEKEINDSSRVIKELRNKLKFEREMYQRDLAEQIKECNSSWQRRWEIQNAKWRNLREMVNRNGEVFDLDNMNNLLKSPEPIDLEYKMPFVNNATPVVSKRPISTTETENIDVNSDVTVMVQSKTPSSAKSTAIASTRPSTKPFRVKQRRSRSAQRWVEHKDADTVKTGTVFKPSLKHKKTVNAAPTLKDMRNQSSYVLQHQQVDTDGEIETRLYKGDIIRTRSGGSQVEFNDVETLLTKSPNKMPSSQQTVIDGGDGDGKNGDENINREGTPSVKRVLDATCVKDSPTIEQRKAELQSNGLFSGYNVAISGHPTGVTSIQSSLADPVAVRKSQLANKKC